MSRKGIAVRALAVGLLLGACGFVWLWVVYGESLRQPVALSEPVTYEITTGMSLAQVLDEFAQRGWLERTEFLRLHGRRTGMAGAIKAGEYTLEPGLTAVELLERFVKGKTVQYALTVVEGWTFKQLLAAIGTHDQLVQKLNGFTADEVMTHLGLTGIHPEGRFLADTYHFPRGTTDVAFLRRAYDAMSSHLAQAWVHRDPDLPLESGYEALILASIIEKETGVATERGQIAGVFVRRLKKGMRLETDPTVIYGLGEAFDGNLRRADLRRDTPYNTYVRKGLPPTPIAIPGKAAIHAALHPSPGDTLFFVAKGDGSHQFSVTYQEHLKAVRRYQLRRRRGQGGTS